jgi:NAD(P)-dependent dehydrogenase (short-subunit alcohol dehydrogenase family)
VKPTDEELAACARVLAALVEDRAQLAELPMERRRELLELAGQLSRPGRAERKQLVKALRRQRRDRERAHDARLVAAARNRSARIAPGHVLPASTASLPNALPPSESSRELLRPRDCYICKQPYHQVHHFYDSLCPPCAELNWAKRFQTARLDGKVALVTGARIKIGFQAALMLLRAGAIVVVTTRFPRDAAERYAREPDFASFRDRLRIHGLDLRHVPSVEAFAHALTQTLPRLDVILNNAAQTVRRPAAFYAHLVEREGRELPSEMRPLLAGEPSAQLATVDAALFPAGRFDLDEQQIDLRTVNSWRLTLAEVPTAELLEVHLVNAVAPFLLNSRLKPLMTRDRTDEKHIVNVSAMEAQFARNKKTDKHPHTNMAKAALNMMTRTSAPDYARAGIFMNSVDTGWITDEDPLIHVARKQEVHDFHPPLDAVDGAARVCDPLFAGLLGGHHEFGHFFKDYRSVSW